MTDNEGRLKALIELTEKAVSELTAKSAELAEADIRLRQSARDIEELREIVGDLSELVETGKKHEWMTASECGAHLRLRPETVRKLAEKKEIRGYKLSDGRYGHWRFDRREVDEDMRGRRTRAAREN
jgi:excisionase family DNA binding protein